MKTPSMNKTIGELDREIESHHQDIADLEKAKAVLEHLMAGDRDVRKIRPPKGKRRGKIGRPRKVKAERGRPRATARKPNRTEPSKPQAKRAAPRSLPNVSQGSDHDRVLAAIQHHDGKCRPREIIAATKFPAWKVSTLLKALEAKQMVTRKGFTVQLAGGKPPLKPDTTPAAGNGHVTPAPVIGGTALTSTPAGVAMVEARNLALKTRVKKGPATFTELLAAMPEERELDDHQRREACMRTIRRLLLKGEIREVGDTYRTV